MPHHLNERVEDPRDLLQKLRRWELEDVLKAEGLPHPKNVPAIIARRILRDNHVDPGKYVGPDGRFIKPKPKEQQVDIQKWTIQQLRKYCGACQVPFEMKDDKAALRAKIEAHQREQRSA
jgi:hypothetical protein